jgi:hypothetical protein
MAAYGVPKSSAKSGLGDVESKRVVTEVLEVRKRNVFET